MPYVVVIVISDLEFGGAQRQVVELANQMDPEEFEVHICSLANYTPLAEGLRDRSTRLHLVERRTRFDLTVVFRLARLLRTLRADIVHSYLFDADIASRLAGRLVGRVTVIGSERNTNYTFKKKESLAYRLTRRCVDLTIANSQAGADFNHRMLGQPTSHYRVVHNGVDTQRFCPQESGDVRAELGLRSGDRVIGMFASFKPQKNHALFLKAARRIIDRFPDVRLLLVGDELYKGMSDSTEYKRELLRQVEDSGLAKYCIFVGNRQDVERYYSACELTVLPSLFEGTPNAALESMACGVPVIASDVSDNHYVIPHGQAGYVFDLSKEDELVEGAVRLLSDGELRSRMSTFAREWAVSEFSGPRLAQKTAAVYREAIAMKGHEPELAGSVRR